MYCTNFEFNGFRARDFGLYIVQFDSPSLSDKNAGSDASFNVSKSAQGYRDIFHGAHYETNLSFSFQACRMNNHHKPMPISVQEQAFFTKWLQRKDGYKKLRFFQHGYEHIEYYAKLKLTWKELGGETIGMEISVECDSPFGYSPTQTYTSSNTSFEIYNDSDEIGYIYPEQVKLQILTGGNLVIANSLDPYFQPDKDYYTEIQNCVAGENIILNGLCKQIYSDNATHSDTLCNDFNYKFPRLINLDEDTLNDNVYSELRRNVFTVSGATCSIEFAYRTIKKGVV